MLKTTKNLLVVALVAVAIFAALLLDRCEKNKTIIEALEAKNSELMAEADKLRSAVEEARDLAERAEKELDEALKMFSEKFGYNDLSAEQLKKINEIAESTPLEADAAAALVYYADFYGIDYSLVLSIIEIESNFQQYLVGTSNDRGFMQIIPITERHLADSFGSKIGIEYDPNRIFEPDYNLGLGISYIAYLASIHGDDLDKILTEYNRGAGGLAMYYAENLTYSSVYSRSVIDRTYKYQELNGE